MPPSIALVWFRTDLRIEDNPALYHAVSEGYSVIPLYIFAPEEESPWAPGSASLWWLHHSLFSLDQSLQYRSSKLCIFRGETLSILRKIIQKTNASALFWNRRYEPEAIARDQKLKATLREVLPKVETFNGSLLHEPWTIQNKSERPFQVFTPFWKKTLSITHPSPPFLLPQKIPFPQFSLASLSSLNLSQLDLLPTIPWDHTFPATWKPGELGAHQNLDLFIREAFDRYSEGRNFPDQAGTSRLSPHLHFGEISPRQIWTVFSKRSPNSEAWKKSSYLTEIGWREFAYHLLYHFPQTPNAPLRTAFNKFAWNQPDPSLLKAWQKGMTGIPMVDAGMRELWKTGWMHNRVRMLSASFLVKNLRYPWIEGAKWFWDTLVDADLAANTLGWQWSAGCGADAAPYFRIFNPVTQGEKFDPQGNYIRRWIPELTALPNRWIHRPWEAPSDVLKTAKLSLGLNYPLPILSLAESRLTALKTFQNFKNLNK